MNRLPYARSFRRLLVGTALAGLVAIAATADEPKPVLRGLLTVAERVLFCIQLPDRDRTVWVATDCPAAGVTVVAHDVSAETVTLRYRERTHVLILPSAKVRAAGQSALRESDGTDLVPPRTIRDAIRNRSLSREEIKPWENTPWFQQFAKQHPEALPPVIR